MVAAIILAAFPEPEPEPEPSSPGRNLSTAAEPEDDWEERLRRSHRRAERALLRRRDGRQRPDREPGL